MMFHRRLQFFLVCLLALPAGLCAAVLTLTAPLDFQVIQREPGNKAHLRIAGTLAESAAKDVRLEFWLLPDKSAGVWMWTALPVQFAGEQFEGAVEAPAGGWHRLEVRAVIGKKVVAQAVVEHVGVGEIFVVAGQSNAANHGEEKQQNKSGKVVSFDGERWRLCNDSQPGASGKGGSFMPPLGDLLADRFNVPIGFVPCGIGATSVREWLPAGSKIANPPTLLGRVARNADGGWESKGAAYANLVSKMKKLGPHGFRAVLWHQGESDANQKDPTRTLAGDLYRQYLEELIRQSRIDIGWDAPWFVAQASYHVPGDESSTDIREAQASSWKDGVALQGPDTDALKAPWRENHGKGVHFTGPGLREHARLWFEKIAPWLDEKLK